ncbi:MAG: YceI family protein [Dokdonella sp.]|jgi:polyisoprenoid-binding protein YceI|uniref:YceI family protein n=1 Tax=Dokdonella sp. TaxID=2291710 RepID=UPI0025C402A6|nr:YceI family protein [Dokdonella sp.]MBK8123649.1 YceI family protein [Dokdonella sp.]HPW02896.1 YceI family protein [Dokdonella sp.]HQX32251.1 YceI family protein [Dokdonella sp.]
MRALRLIHLIASSPFRFAFILPHRLLAGLLALATSQPAPGSDPIQIRELDSARSRASFSVRVLWMFPVEGQFSTLRGQVRIDPARQLATVEARIVADTVSMRREGTENWARSAEFFDVERFPEIEFRSVSFPIKRLREGGDLPGRLTMRGRSQPVLFSLQPASCAAPAVDCAVNAQGEVRRSEFGMRSRRATLSDHVHLNLDIYLSDLPTPAS